MQKTVQTSYVEIEVPSKNIEVLNKFFWENFSKNEEVLELFDEIGEGVNYSHSSDENGNEFLSYGFHTSNPQKWIHLVNENEYNGSGRHWSGNGVRVSKLSAYCLKKLIDASIMVDEVLIQ